MKFITLILVFVSVNIGTAQVYNYSQFEASNEQLIFTGLPKFGEGDFSLELTPHEIKVKNKTSYKIYEVTSINEDSGILTVKTENFIFFIRKSKTVILGHEGNIMLKLLI